MKKPLIIAKHELKQVLREPQFLIPYLLVPALTIGIYSFVVLHEGIDPEVSAASSRMIILVVGVLITSMTLMLCADSFAGEKERNSLEILLCSPISLRGLFFGKLLGILPIPILLGWIAQFMIYALSNTWGFSFITGLMGLQLLLLTPVSSLFLCSVTIFISLRMQTVRSAAQVASLIVLLYLFFIQFTSTWFFESSLFAFVLLIMLFLISVVIIAGSVIRFENLLFIRK